MVSKEARVKEELVVNKDVRERTETVSDTVRRTEVEVEDERGARHAEAGTTELHRRSRTRLSRRGGPVWWSGLPN